MVQPKYTSVATDKLSLWPVAQQAISLKTAAYNLYKLIKKDLPAARENAKISREIKKLDKDFIEGRSTFDKNAVEQKKADLQDQLTPSKASKHARELRDSIIVFIPIIGSIYSAIVRSFADKEAKKAAEKKAYIDALNNTVSANAVDRTTEKAHIHKARAMREKELADLNPKTVSHFHNQPFVRLLNKKRHIKVNMHVETREDACRAQSKVAKQHLAQKIENAKTAADRLNDQLTVNAKAARDLELTKLNPTNVSNYTNNEEFKLLFANNRIVRPKQHTELREAAYENFIATRPVVRKQATEIQGSPVKTSPFYVQNWTNVLKKQKAERDAEAAKVQAALDNLPPALEIKTSMDLEFFNFNKKTIVDETKGTIRPKFDQEMRLVQQRLRDAAAYAAEQKTAEADRKAAEEEAAEAARKAAEEAERVRQEAETKANTPVENTPEDQSEVSETSSDESDDVTTEEYSEVENGSEVEEGSEEVTSSEEESEEVNSDDEKKVEVTETADGGCIIA